MRWTTRPLGTFGVCVWVIGEAVWGVSQAAAQAVVHDRPLAANVIVPPEKLKPASPLLAA